MAAAGYIMSCTVCNWTVTHVKDWNHHLVSRVHEEKAKLSLREWGENVRKCAIVLYASFSIADNSTAVSVIKKFTGGTSLVTNFLRTVRRPKMAILQFESSEKVAQVLAQGATQSFGNRRIQLRQLGDFLEFEWEELMTTFLGRRMVCADDVPMEVNSEEFGDGGPLNSQITSILNQIEIPDEEFNAVQRILEHIQLGLKQATKIDYTLALYRNNYLKFRNNVSSNTYLVFIYDLVDRPHGFEVPPKGTWRCIKKTLSHDMRENSSGLGHLAFLSECTQIVHKESGATIKLITDPTKMAEVQLSSLVTFYCRLEPRVKILLGLLYYWTTVNKIMLTPRKVSEVQAFWRSPDPTNLEWLLLFFLCHKEKIIPAPVKILERPHKPIRLYLNFGGENNDHDYYELGFDNSTTNFEPKWQQSQNLPFESCESDIIALTVIELFKKFMGFCNEKLSRSCLVDTRTCKLLYSHATARDNKEQDLLNNLKGRVPNIFMIHPMSTEKKKWRIVLDKTKWFQIVVPAMNETAKNLDKFLDNLRNGNGISDNGEELQRALHLNME